MRRAAFAVVIFVLAALNVWRWWPDEKLAKPVGPRPVASSTAEQLRLSLKVTGDVAAPTVVRDIFQSRELSLPVAKPKEEPVVQVVPVEPPPPAVVEPPPKSPEQIAEEAARAELSQIKLIGVIFRNAKGQAYLSKGEQTYLVSLGDSVARFTVTSITAESVKLYDSRTQVGAEIPVLGK